jgi:hypothetical protein
LRNDELKLDDDDDDDDGALLVAFAKVDKGNDELPNDGGGEPGANALLGEYAGGAPASIFTPKGFAFLNGASAVIFTPNGFAFSNGDDEAAPGADPNANVDVDVGDEDGVELPKVEGEAVAPNEKPLLFDDVAKEANEDDDDAPRDVVAVVVVKLVGCAAAAAAAASVAAAAVGRPRAAFDWPNAKPSVVCVAPDVANADDD